MDETGGVVYKGFKSSFSEKWPQLSLPFPYPIVTQESEGDNWHISTVSDPFVAHGWRAFTSGRISRIIQLYVADQWSDSTRQQRAWWCKRNRLALLWAISSHKKKGQEKSTSLLISLLPDANQGSAGFCGVKAMASGRGHA
ncbi:hypothetical protein MUK42_17257 [Musa troglodytarum]|uniref:Uncharacterized protein n=1 Tax=Musa troglodytarum TaxID=320322 RepID=A0A9E7I570_9LILI|nr:hypothetical protein MUK42_17257 [Musa troglodytarum]